MRILFKRDMGIGDIIMLSGCIIETKKKFPNNEIALQTLNPEVATLIPEIDFVANQILTGDVEIDMNMVYEKDAKKPVWIAYADFLFEKYDVKDIMPKIVIDDSIDKPFHKYAVLHPCKSSASRTLPKEKWDEVVTALGLMGYKTVVVGSSKDFNLKGADLNLQDKLSLKQIGGYIDKADIFVGLDSGIMHIAQGTDTPVVGIFTIAAPQFRIWREDNTTAICPTSECRFCLAKLDPTQSVNCDKLDCVRSITVKDIIDGVKKHV